MSNYILLRLVICIIVFIIIILKSKKSVVKNNKNQKKWLITRFILCYICFVAMYFIPFENLFYTFPTAESAFGYTTPDKILNITYGKDSCMVVAGSKKGSYSSSIMNKSKNGYKINTNRDDSIQTVYDEGVMIMVYHAKGTNDYYIRSSYIAAKGEEERIFSDNRNSKFAENKDFISNMEGKKYNAILISAYVYDLNENYRLYINGKEISLNIN